jgi:hypothetical protein
MPIALANAHAFSGHEESKLTSSAGARSARQEAEEIVAEANRPKRVMFLCTPE